jgi:hypothetical protein
MSLVNLTEILLSGPGRELAYLDPGSGSFIFQLIIAGIAGSALAIRMYWSRIVRKFRGEALESDEDDAAALESASLESPSLESRSNED